MSDKDKQTEEDKALWEAVAKTVDPIEHDLVTVSEMLEDEPKRLTALPAKKMLSYQPVQRLEPPIEPHISRDIDRRTRQKLERGKMAIEAVLDLHGHSRDQARDAVGRFISQSAAMGRRCVLVITGKGRETGGILRKSVPEWLKDPHYAPHVLHVSPARGKHGGGGAWYVLLRRTRT